VSAAAIVEPGRAGKAVRRASWVAMAVVVGTALFVGTFAGRDDPTPAERARSIAVTIKCPTCRSQSVAESDAPAAEFIREDIAKRIADGQSDAEIRDYFASRYGEQILLTPPRTGISALVWTLPVVVLVGAVAGLVAAFRRWRRWA
jgi:cytochrome c-type biogenesis protein CcmH